MFSDYLSNIKVGTIRYSSMGLYRSHHSFSQLISWFFISRLGLPVYEGGMKCSILPLTCPFGLKIGMDGHSSVGKGICDYTTVFSG